MNNLTKTVVTVDAAQCIVARQFGTDKRITSFEELKDGFFNSAYRIVLHDNFQLVLKVAPPPGVRVLRYEKDIMRVEVETMRLASSRTEMPVPEIYFFDESRSLLPVPFFGMRFVNGLPLNKFRDSLSVSEQSAIDQACGRYLRQMNDITGTQFGSIANSTNPPGTWSHTFEQMLASVLQDAEDARVKLPLPSGDFLGLASQRAAILDEVTIPALVHWDCWDGNIFVDPDTRQVNGIIDFERALWADPLMEVNFGAFGVNQEFLKGYGQPYPFSPSQIIRRNLYNIYLFLIMVIECTYRRYPTNDQEIWSRQRLAEEISIANRLITHRGDV